MVTKMVFIVFVLPVILSVMLASAVMADVLSKPGRQLDMVPILTLDGSQLHGAGPQIQIVGLSNQYSMSEPVEIRIMANAGIASSSDSAASVCADLYITIYRSGTSDVVVQDGFFDQCLEVGGSSRTMLPTGGLIFAEVVESPGSYDVVAELISEDIHDLSVRGTFTVK